MGIRENRLLGQGDASHQIHRRTELECLNDIAERVSFRAGETLFHAGDRDYGFFVVLKGGRNS